MNVFTEGTQIAIAVSHELLADIVFFERRVLDVLFHRVLDVTASTRDILEVLESWMRKFNRFVYFIDQKPIILASLIGRYLRNSPHQAALEFRSKVACIAGCILRLGQQIYPVYNLIEEINNLLNHYANTGIPESASGVLYSKLLARIRHLHGLANEVTTFDFFMPPLELLENPLERFTNIQDAALEAPALEAASEEPAPEPAPVLVAAYAPPAPQFVPLAFYLNPPAPVSPAPAPLVPPAPEEPQLLAVPLPPLPPGYPEHLIPPMPPALPPPASLSLPVFMGYQSSDDDDVVSVVDCTEDDPELIIID